MKRRVSYTRITGTAFLVIVLIFGIDFLRRSSAGESTDEQLKNSIRVSTEPASEDKGIVPENAATVTTESSEYILGLDNGNYKYKNEKKTASDMSTGPLILVNKEHPFENFSAQKDIIKICDKKNTDSYKLAYLTLEANETIIPHLNNMLDDFNSNYHHNDVTVSSSFVSYDDQANNHISIPSATEYITSDKMFDPGYTEHHTGYAIDFLIVSENMKISAFDGTGDYSWILSNCYKYGFIQRYPDSKQASTGVEKNPGHLRYVGFPHSYIMHDKKYTLEEYLTVLKDYSYSGQHLEYELSGVKYEMYYVPSQGDITEVPVPYEFINEISGNNYDGFIVTVKRTDKASQESQNNSDVTTTNAVTTAPDVT